MPPLVQCKERTPAEQVDPVPAAFDDFKVWAVKVLGILERAYQARTTTADCLDAKKRAGVIR